MTVGLLPVAAALACTRCAGGARISAAYYQQACAIPDIAAWRGLGQRARIMAASSYRVAKTNRAAPTTISVWHVNAGIALI